MQTDFSGHGIYLFFNCSSACNTPACRVLGPYRTVSFRAKGIWAYGRPGEEPLLVATQNVLSWDLHGLDDPLWGQVTLIAPSRPTSAREIEAANDWIRPDPV